jgi:cytosine permease
MQKVRFLNVEEGFTLRPILPHSRLHWGKLAQIYASCMASAPILLVGFWLSGNFSLVQIALIISVSAIVVTIFDFANSALGADTGLPASILAQGCFGSLLSKFVVSVPLVLVGWGWFGVQLALAIKALLVVFGIENLMVGPNALLISLSLTPIVGALFAFTPINRRLARYGVTNISILLLTIFCFVSLFEGFKFLNFQGWADFLFQINASGPHSPLSFGSAVLIGVCASQFVMISDYSRFSRRIFPDSLLIPLSGVTPAQVLFCVASSILGLLTAFHSDFFVSLIQAGVPRWAFILLFLSQWNAARFVVIYSAGLAGASLIEDPSPKARWWITLLSVLSGTLLVVFGIHEYLIHFLVLQAMVFPPIGAILLVDHFIVKKRHWNIREKGNLKALCSLLTGYILGVLIYIYFPNCYAFLGSTVVAVGFYLLLNLQRNNSSENISTQEKNPRKPVGKWQRVLLYLSFFGLAGAALFPIFFPPPFSDILVLISVVLMAVAFVKYFSKISGLAIEDNGLGFHELSLKTDAKSALK